MNVNHPSPLQAAGTPTRAAAEAGTLPEAIEQTLQRFSELLFNYAYSVRVTPDGQIEREWTTGNFEAVTGFTIDEYDGAGGIETHVHPDDRPLYQRWRDTLAAGKMGTADLRIRGKDGAYRCVANRARPEFDADGRIVRIVGAATDITERKAAEQALRDSEERYRTLFTSIDEGFCICEMIVDDAGRPVDYRFLEVNGMFAEMTGIVPDAVGRTARDLVPGLEDAWIETYARVGLGGESLRFESHSPAMGRAFDVYASPFGPKGNGRFSLVFKDVSAQKATEQALRESEARFRGLADAAPMLIWMAGLDKKCDYFNAGWLQFTGRTLEEELGDGWVEGVHPDDRERCLATYSNAFDAREPFEMDYRMRRHDGVYRWLVDRAAPRYTPDGTFVGYIGVCIDMHERREAERQARFLADLERELQPLADPGAIVSSAARLLGTYLGVDRCAYASVEADEDHFTITGDYTRGDMHSIVGHFAMSDFGAEVLRLMRAGEPYVIHDIDAEAPAGMDLSAYRQTAIRAVICVPLHKDGRFVAAMAVHQRTPRVWTARDLDVVPIVVNRCWESLERASVETALRQSEARARALLHAIPDVVLVYPISADGPGTFVEANDVAVHTYGYTRAELLGMSILDIVLPSSISVPGALDTLRRDGRGRFETVHRTRDGREIPFETMSHVFHLHGREMVLSLARDMTERRRAEAALRQSEARFRQIAESLPDIVYTCDPKGRVEYLNRRWYAYTGQPADSDAASATQPMHPEDLPRVTAAWARAQETEETFECECRLRRHDGVYHWFLTRLVAVRDLSGRVVQWFGTATDIHAQKSVEAELESRVAARTVALARANLSLEARNQELQDFAYVASHDLQEPLRKIRTFADLLVADFGSQLDDEARHYVHRMLDASGRMSRLITDLLAFSRISTRGRAFAPVDLRETTKAVLNDLELLIRDTGGNVDVGHLPVVEADGSQMRQLMQNLIGNALKYHRDGVAPQVRVQGALEEDGRGGRNARVVVEDDGIGFDEKYAERIFAPFQRLHGRGKYEGTGIGLAICRKIAERHGGTITARSVPGGGAVFTVTLPVLQPEPDPEAEA